MPLDGTDLYDNHPVAKLGAVERLLATEQQWCKGRLRDAYGRHCLVGAIEAVGARQMLHKPNPACCQRGERQALSADRILQR
jgi:hypothetical protein